MVQNVSFEWHVGEDAYAVPPGADSHHLHALERRRFGMRRSHTVAWSLRILVVGIVAVAMSTGAGLSPGRLARLALWQGVEQALANEEAAWYAQDHSAYRKLIAPEMPESWVTEWRTQWQTRIDESDYYTIRLLVAQRIGALVQAQVLVTQPAADWSRLPTHRETRFYRVTDDGDWLRTLPPDSFWGPRQTLSTEHLHFVFHAPDATAVTTAAGALEDAYIAAYKRLALPLPAPVDKPTIVVKNDVVYTWTVLDNRIEISSPLLMPITDELSNADYLGRVTMHRLLYHALHTDPHGASASGERRFYRWRFEVSALRGWLRNELLPQSAPWRAEAKALFRSQLPARYPLQLDDFKGRSQMGPGVESFASLSPRDALIWQYMVAESFFDFLTDSYGRDCIPQLLQGFEQHDAWSDLIAAQFDVSEDVLVVKWNLYLNEEYQLDSR